MRQNLGQKLDVYPWACALRGHRRSQWDSPLRRVWMILKLSCCKGPVPDHADHADLAGLTKAEWQGMAGKGREKVETCRT